MDNNKIPTEHEEQDQLTENSSRFSRRRFLQTGVAASPLLLSVKSPMAWGCGTGSNGSVNAYVSGNASTTGSCTTAGCQTPKWWKSTIRAHEYHSMYPIRQALNWSNVRDSTLFNDIFLASCFSWQRCDNSRWQYKIVEEQCSKPSFYDSLDNYSFGSKITLRVQKKRDSTKRFDVNICSQNLHENLTAGFLNSMLAPDVIRSDYYPTDIKNATQLAIHYAANQIQANRSSSLSTASALESFSRKLERSWRS